MAGQNQKYHQLDKMAGQHLKDHHVNCKQGLVHDNAGHIHGNKPQPLMPAFNQMRFGDAFVGAV